MRKIALSIAVAFGMQAGAQTDTVMYRHFNNGTIDTASISTIDSITFGYVALSGACNGLTSLTYNGYTYDLVEIGGQCWFKENLRTTIYRDSTPIDYHGTDNIAWQNNTGAYAWYDNDSTAYDSIYGKLYNWYAVDNSAGLCPTGWHVPSDSAWTVLDSFMAHNGFNYDGSIMGNKYAKAIADTVLWDAHTGVGAVGNTDYPTYQNKSGFSGLPGGERHNTGNYYSIGKKGYWWSSSQDNAPHAWGRGLNYSYSNFDRPPNYKEGGFSVRCLRD